MTPREKMLLRGSSMTRAATSGARAKTSPPLRLCAGGPLSLALLALVLALLCHVGNAASTGGDPHLVVPAGDPHPAPVSAGDHGHPAPGTAGAESGGDHHNGSGGHATYHVASVNFEGVQTPFAIALWVFIATLAKIGFHMVNKLSTIFPESCLLIILGLVIGFLLFYTHLMRVSPLTPYTFFMFMLPPIVLDAGYFMPNRLFFDNLGTILLFAVVGTIFNTLTIGVSLWSVGLTGLYGVELNILDTFLFSALISAVDPVAVLAVFEEIHVNEVLYIVVFGESLLNDAVTVVLYNMFEAYTEMGESNLMYTDVLLGFAAFFVVALGGTAIGVIWGFLMGFVTRFTNHVRVIEPLLVFVMAYLSHLNAEMFHLSGILAITFCGISAKNYVDANISMKSRTTIKYAMKMLSSVAETVIFLFLGVSMVNDEHDWNTWFVILTILFCTVYRAIGVLILTTLANHFRLHKLNKVEEFVMAYGGLRGAVAFALALTIDEKIVKHRSMFVTATIAMVYFTVFVQGITIKPLVELLRVKKSSKRKVTMNERIHERFMDHLMAGIEEIAGHFGNYHMRDKFKYYDNKYLRKWFLRGDNVPNEPKILETFSKLNVRDAKDMMLQHGCLPNSNLTTDVSLASLFRNFTQTNLDGQCSLVNNDSSYCNLDMQELEYSPSAKDLNDARLHHILNDAMFKAPRRHRKYSRSFIHEPDSHPPFHHMMRMQIRHMLSEQLKNPTKKSSKKSKSANENGFLFVRHHEAVILENGTVNNGKDGETAIPVYEDATYYYSNPGLEEEDGITFTARPTEGATSSPSANRMTSHHLLDTGIKDNDVLRGRIIIAGSSPSCRRVHPPPSPPPPRTATEAQLPWRRTGYHGEFDEDGVERDMGSAAHDVHRPSYGSAPGASGTSEVYAYGHHDDQPVVQHEFPSWVENREYNAYVSPTSTFLNRAVESHPIPVYNIFEESAELTDPTDVTQGASEMRGAGALPPATPTEKHTTQL